MNARIPEQALARAAELREQALADDTGWKVVESLTTEVGPRLAGSEADARALAARHGQSELLAEELRIAVLALERLVGRIDVEDVLDRLFSGFCIGK